VRQADRLRARRLRSCPTPTARNRRVMKMSETSVAAASNSRDPSPSSLASTISSATDSDRVLVRGPVAARLWNGRRSGFGSISTTDTRVAGSMDFGAFFQAAPGRVRRAVGRVTLAQRDQCVEHVGATATTARNPVRRAGRRS
jgi:hypothetical protein